MEFGEKLREARKKAGLSQDKMAETTGIPKRTIQDWERAIATPPEYVQDSVIDRLWKIAAGKGKRYELRMFRNCFADTKENPFWYEVLTTDGERKPMSFAHVSEVTAYVEELEAQGYTEAR